MDHRLRVTLHDGRYIIGTFLAFDKHLNLVLSESEEFRLSKSASKSAVVEERTEKRTLGLILIRGENVVSLAVEGPPPPSAQKKVGPGGPGQVARGAGRGVLPPPPMGMAPPVGLGAAPVHGTMGMLPPLPPGGFPHPGMGRGGPPPGY